MAEHGAHGDGCTGVPLARALRAGRAQAGLTQEELAERAGLGVRTVRDLELGRVLRPHQPTIEALGAALGLDVDALRGRPAAGRGPRQLPADLPDVVGRSAELGELERLLGRDAGGAVPAVAAIAGRAGVGKTALAVHAAHRLRARFPGGQLYADLRGTGRWPADPGDVLAWLLRALGVDRTALPDGCAERSAALRDRLAGAEALVVLDDAADEEQVRPLLPGAGSSAALVTSRRPLAALETAQRLDLDPLAPEDAVALLARAAGGDRVAAEPCAAREVVALCEHLPLTVRIAGARLATRPAWTLAHLRDLLRDEDQRLDQLRLGDRDVRAALHGSYAGLPPACRRALRLLGTLPSPVVSAPVAAAALDLPPEQAVALAEQLVDARLLEALGSASARYRCPDLVRLYARERAQQEDPTEERWAARRRVRALARPAVSAGEPAARSAS